MNVQLWNAIIVADVQSCRVLICVPLYSWEGSTQVTWVPSVLRRRTVTLSFTEWAAEPWPTCNLSQICTSRPFESAAHRRMLNSSSCRPTKLTISIFAVNGCITLDMTVAVAQGGLLISIIWRAHARHIYTSAVPEMSNEYSCSIAWIRAWDAAHVVDCTYTNPSRKCAHGLPQLHVMLLTLSQVIFIIKCLSVKIKVQCTMIVPNL